jgi:hypothetical protein
MFGTQAGLLALGAKRAGLPRVYVSQWPLKARLRGPEKKQRPHADHSGGAARFRTDFPILRSSGTYALFNFRFQYIIAIRLCQGKKLLSAEA